MKGWAEQAIRNPADLGEEQIYLRHFVTELMGLKIRPVLAKNSDTKVDPDHTTRTQGAETTRTAGRAEGA